MYATESRRQQYVNVMEDCSRGTVQYTRRYDGLWPWHLHIFMGWRAQRSPTQLSGDWNTELAYVCVRHFNAVRSASRSNLSDILLQALSY